VARHQRRAGLDGGLVSAAGSATRYPARLGRRLLYRRPDADQALAAMWIEDGFQPMYRRIVAEAARPDASPTVPHRS
jgi:hypothetical protein